MCVCVCVCIFFFLNKKKKKCLFAGYKSCHYEFIPWFDKYYDPKGQYQDLKWGPFPVKGWRSMKFCSCMAFYYILVDVVSKICAKFIIPQLAGYCGYGVFCPNETHFCYFYFIIIISHLVHQFQLIPIFLYVRVVSTSSILTFLFQRPILLISEYKSLIFQYFPFL